MKPWMVLVLGVGLFGAGIYTFLSTRDFIGDAVSANGVVIDVQREWDLDDDDYTYYPRVRFNTENGQPYEFTGRGSSSRTTFDVGKEVRILYDPADPHQARIDSFSQLWFAPLILGGIGLVLTAFSAGTILSDRLEPQGQGERKPQTGSQSTDAAPNSPRNPVSPVADRDRRH